MVTCPEQQRKKHLVCVEGGILGDPRFAVPTCLRGHHQRRVALRVLLVDVHVGAEPEERHDVHEAPAAGDHQPVLLWGGGGDPVGTLRPTARIPKWGGSAPWIRAAPLNGVWGIPTHRGALPSRPSGSYRIGPFPERGGKGKLCPTDPCSPTAW